MRLIYFGTGTFALPALEALRDSITLVVTQPDRPSGRGMQMHPSPVKIRATQLGLNVETPEKSRSPEFLERLRSQQADALVVASYGQILSQAVLDSATLGGINLHGSILPLYRGAAPIQRAILDGQTETGITLMQMDKGMDTGDMIAVVRTPIDPDETYTLLQDRLALLAAEMAAQWLPKIANGDYSRTAQDSIHATIAKKVEKEEAQLHFSEPAALEYNRFRAFTEAPGAYLKTNRGQLRVRQARLSTAQGTPGELLPAGDSLVVAFQDGALDIIEILPEGKRRMTGRDFANGARLRPGDSLIS